MRARAIVIGSLVAVVSIGAVGFVLASPESGSPSAALMSQGPDIEASFDESTSVEVSRDAYTVTERDGNGLMRATVA